MLFPHLKPSSAPHAILNTLNKEEITRIKAASAFLQGPIRKTYGHPFPLHDAVSKGKVDDTRLLCLCFPIDERNKHKKTPLHAAIDANQSQCIPILLEEGASLHATYEIKVVNKTFSLPPFCYALMQGAVECAKALAKNHHAVLQERVTGLGNPLHVAVYFGQLTSERFLLEQQKAHDWSTEKNKQLETPIQLATRRPDRTTLEVLIRGQLHRKGKEREPYGPTPPLAKPVADKSRRPHLQPGSSQSHDVDPRVDRAADVMQLIPGKVTQTTRNYVAITALKCDAPKQALPFCAQPTNLPANSDTKYIAGLARAKQGQLTKAIAHFQTALKIYQTKDPQSEEVADTLRNLASCYYNLNRYKKALEIDRQALKLYYEIAGNRPTQKKADTWYALGQSYMHLKQLESAKKAFERARLVVLSVDILDPMVKRIDEHLYGIDQALRARQPASIPPQSAPPHTSFCVMQ